MQDTNDINVLVIEEVKDNVFVDFDRVVVGFDIWSGSPKIGIISQLVQFGIDLSKIYVSFTFAPRFIGVPPNGFQVPFGRRGKTDFTH
nr:hypothetical protein [Paucidesulfovibrio gracilis]